MKLAGQLLAARASATHLVSCDTSSSVEGMFFAGSMRVRRTECLCSGWWCDLKSRKRSVFVAFL